MGLKMGLYTWAHIYTNTPRSLNYRCSGVQDWTTRKPTPPCSLNYRRSGVQDWTTRKPTPPRSLNYRRSGVQDWTRREYKESRNDKYPPQSQLATCCIEAGAKLREGREGSPLVKMSANWEVVGTLSTRTSPMATLSRTKCRLISTCFVRWCWTGLVKRYTALTLSQ